MWVAVTFSFPLTVILVTLYVTSYSPKSVCTTISKSPVIAEAKTVISDYSESRTWYYADRKQAFSLLTPDKDTSTGFIKVRNNETNAKGVVPECMSGYWDCDWHVWANLNSFPSVKKGESIWVYAEYGEYCWCITESGEVGSVPKRVIDLM